MATLKLNYSSETNFTVTNLHSLASSDTAGWSSAYVDNTTNLYLDALVQFVFDPANTAPANDRAFYIFAWGSLSSSNLPSTGATSGGTVGTQGSLTFPSILDRQQLPFTVIPYIGQDTIIKSKALSICEILGITTLPPFWGVAVINYTGATIGASGNTVSWRGVKLGV